MKKFLSTVALAATMTTAANAGGMIADLTVGISTPIIAPTVQLGTTQATAFDVVQNFGLGIGPQINMWAEFDHLVPIIPNIRVEQATLGYAGTATQSYTFAGQTFSASSASVFNLNNVDGIAYWGVPFATLIPFVDKVDFGLGAKIINGAIGVEAIGLKTFMAPIPYVWLRGAVKVPVVNVGLSIDTKFIGTDAISPSGIFGIIANFNETVYKATWGLSLPIPILTLEAGVELGYKATSLMANMPNTVYINGTFNGVILGIYGQFGI